LNESITMTDRLRNELVNSGAFTVIERSKMDEILQEQGLQQTGCTSDECAVEIGKLKAKDKPKAFLLSAIFPGWGQSYQEKKVQKYLYPILFFGSITVAALNKSDGGDSSKKTSDTMYMVAGAIYALNLLDIFLLPPGYTNSVQLSGSGDRVNLSATLPLD
jgi:curli biogenesis system outer membrane secretion channel CsgG